MKMKLKRSHKALIAIVVAIPLSLIALSTGVKLAGESWLHKHGNPEAKIGDFFFNPFTGRVEFGKIVGGRGENQRLSLFRAEVDLEYWPLFKKRIFLKEVKVSGITLNVEQNEAGELIFGGISLPTPQEPQDAPADDSGEPWGFGVGSIVLEDIDITYRDPSISANVDLKSAEVSSLETWTPLAESPYSVLLSLNGGEFELDGKVRPFAEEVTAKGDLTIDQLPLAWITPILKDSGISSFDGALSLDISHDIAFMKEAGTLTADYKGEVDLSGLKVERNPAIVSLGAAKWAGSGGLNELITLKGVISLGDFSASTVEGGELLTLNALTLNDLSMDGPEKISFGELLVKGLSALKTPSGETFTLNEALINDLSLVDSSRLEVGRAALDTFAVNLSRNKDGQLSFAELLKPFEASDGGSEGEAAPQSAQAASKSNNFSYSIGEVELKGDNSFTFKDDSVSPNYKSNIEEILLTVSEIDSSKIEHPSPFDLHIATDRYGKIDGAGEWTLFKEKPNGSLKLKIDSLNLAPLTSYSQRHIGYRLDSGVLGVNTEATVDEGVLKTVAYIDLKRFEMSSLTPEQKDEYTEELGVPVTLIISLLKDKDENISLEIPMEGDLDSPDVGIGPTVAIVVKKAILSGAKMAAINYFSPLGALSLAGKAFDLLTALSFDPIIYADGDPQLSEEAKAHLDTVAALMDDRPGVSLRFMGVATESDRLVFAKAEAERLAEERAKAAAAEEKMESTTDSGDVEKVDSVNVESVDTKSNEIGASGGAEEEAAQAESAPEPAAPPLPEIDNEVLYELARTRSSRVKDYLTSKGIAQERIIEMSPLIKSGESDLPAVEISL
ncbi:MAG: hypothetical protein C0608_02995 [Deltaproteobacteria bacterium]|nr:MAG: hypothetical protein C0608_02995 [Deltaproteobacteria bacterium]